MKQWYVLRSKPKREASAAAVLERAEIEVYLPQISTQRERAVPSLVPFFPSYLFARLDPDRGELQMARYAQGIMYVVSYGEEPCPVPDDLVSLIKERLASSRGLVPAVEFRQGDRVLVTAGALRDVEAIFDRHLSATGRVQVLVQMLQRLCRVDLHVGQLRLLRKATGAARA